jgi:hypothetical protein
MSSAGDCEFVFLNFKCSNWLTTGGMQAKILLVEGIRWRRNRLSKKKAWLPLYSRGAGFHAEV